MSDTIYLREPPKDFFFAVPREDAGDGYIKHVVCEGARFHVLYWTTQGKRCSEPDCIINKPRAARSKTYD